tara:strand:- start:124 stop:519 length:396 start_codon:yes stop_codon:yes gene_type:complete
MTYVKKHESKFGYEVRFNLPGIVFYRIENLSVPGLPDMLCAHPNRGFFTLELKVTKGKKVDFSPHQIAFHKTCPGPTFILVKALGQRALILYQGIKIQEILDKGLDASPLVQGPMDAFTWSKIHDLLIKVA